MDRAAAGWGYVLGRLHEGEGGFLAKATGTDVIRAAAPESGEDFVLDFDLAGGKIQKLTVVADLCEAHHHGAPLPAAPSHESREHNRQVVLDFLECKGAERDQTRLPLLSDDGRVEMEFHLPTGLVA